MIWAIAAFVVATAALAGLEAVWPARRTRWWRRDARTDVAYWIVTPLVSHALVAIVVGAAMLVLPRAAWGAELPLAVQIAVVAVAGDLLGYAAHVALHRASLWRFHAIHHSATALDWLATSRLHPIDDVVQRVVQLVPLACAGFDPAILAAYLPALGIVAVLQHANVPWTFGPLRYVLASPAFHAWHHTCEERGRDKNFAALFPIWDLVFGTFYLPREAPSVLGVREVIPDGIVAQLAWPFGGVSAKHPGTRVPGGAT